MNVSCPECRSVFRVDPAKIPTAGVRARCSVCGGVMSVGGGPPVDVEFAPATPAPQPPVVAAPEPQVPVVTAPEPQVPVVAAPEPPAPVVVAEPPVIAAAVTPPPVQAVVPELTRPLTPVRPITPVRPAAPAPGRPSPFVLPATPVARPQAQTGPVQPLRPSAFAPRPLQPPVTPTARPSVTLRPAAPVAAPIASPAAAPVATPVAAQAAPAIPTATPRQTAPVARSAYEGLTPASPARATGTPTSVAQISGGPKRTPINPFLSNDPNVKARRLARALISDLVTYFPQKREEGLRNGTMKELFREEIRKSYEEFVEQVGREFADSTQHFKEAVNDILCGGQKIF